MQPNGYASRRRAEGATPYAYSGVEDSEDGQFQANLTPSSGMRRYLRTLVSIIKIVHANGEPGRQDKEFRQT